MRNEKLIKGLGLKVGPLGENDRLLTLLSDDYGISRLAVPGGRKPRSSLSGAAPLNLLEIQTTGKNNLHRIKQLKIIKSYSKLGQKLETLTAAQTLSELILLLVANNDPISGMLNTLLIHLDRLEEEINTQEVSSINTLAKCIQACVHLLALGGFGLPVQRCCISGEPLDAPLGKWDWRCSFIPEEGFAIGSYKNARIELNPSELALLQRLTKANLPLKKGSGELIGPREVWIKLLNVIDKWTTNHLTRNLQAIHMMQTIFLKQ